MRRSVLFQNAFSFTDWIIPHRAFVPSARPCWFGCSDRWCSGRIILALSLPLSYRPRFSVRSNTTRARFVLFDVHASTKIANDNDSVLLSARDVTTRGLLPLFSTRNTCHFRVVEPGGCRHAECLPQEHINGFSPGVISQAAMHTMVSVVSGQQRSAARTWGFGDPFVHPLGRVISHKQAWFLTRPLASLLALALLTKNERRK